MSTMQIRVYYEDTDCGNVVYYANYLKYMERSRTEFLREKGIELEKHHKDGILFVVTEANIRYKSSAKYNDLITVESKLVKLSSVVMVFETEIYNQNKNLLVTGTIKLACVSKDGKLQRIPKELIDKLK